MVVRADSILWRYLHSIEQINAELKADPLAHMPSGVFNANAAWLTIAAMAPRPDPRHSHDHRRQAGPGKSPDDTDQDPRHPGTHRSPSTPPDPAPTGRLEMGRSIRPALASGPEPARLTSQHLTISPIRALTPGQGDSGNFNVDKTGSKAGRAQRALQASPWTQAYLINES